VAIWWGFLPPRGSNQSECTFLSCTAAVSRLYCCSFKLQLYKILLKDIAMQQVAKGYIQNVAEDSPKGKRQWHDYLRWLCMPRPFLLLSAIYNNGRHRPGRSPAPVGEEFATGPRISDDLWAVIRFHHLSFVMLLRVCPQNNSRLKSVRSAKKFANPDLHYFIWQLWVFFLVLILPSTSTRETGCRRWMCLELLEYEMNHHFIFFASNTGHF